MKVLVLGGTGILGHGLVPALIQDGHDVWVLSDGRGQFPPPPNVIAHFIANRNDEMQLSRALSKAPAQTWDFLIDLVCYSRVQAETIMSAIRGRCVGYIIASTTFVYDPTTALPLREDSRTGNIGQLGGYASNKLAMETAWRANHSEAIILRMPHIIAPGCLPGAVPLHCRDPLLLHRVRHNWPIWMVDGGTQLLNFVDGKIVAAAIVKILRSHSLKGRTLNVAYPAPITGSSYVRTMAELLGKEADIRNVPSRLIRDSQWGWKLSSVSRACDVSLISLLLGAPSIGLEESMKNCLPFWDLLRPEERADPLERLSSIDLNDSANSLLVLQNLAKQRIRSEIDARMNQAPLPILPNAIGLNH